MRLYEVLSGSSAGAEPPPPIDWHPAINATENSVTIRRTDMIPPLESRPVFPSHRAVDDVGRPFSRKHAPHLARCPRLQSRHRLLAVPGGVRSDDDDLAAPQRVRIRQGLGVGRVE